MLFALPLLLRLHAMSFDQLLFILNYDHFVRRSLLAEALFLAFVDGLKETSAMDRKWLH